MMISWGIKWCHWDIGKDVGRELRPDRKWALNVWMLRSSMLSLWEYGGTSWYGWFNDCSNVLVTIGSSLSKMCFVGWNPRCSSVCRSVVISSCHCVEWRFLMGWARMRLHSCMYVMAMY